MGHARSPPCGWVLPDVVAQLCCSARGWIAHLLVLTCLLYSLGSSIQIRAGDWHLHWAVCTAKRSPTAAAKGTLPAEPWRCQNHPAAARADSALSAELLEYPLPTGTAEMCPSVFKSRSHGMPVLTGAQPLGPPQITESQNG